VLEAFTVGTFADRLGEPFRLVRDAASPPLSLELFEATALGGDRSAGGAESDRQRAPFSIVFRGPAGVLLPQRIYRLEHAALGAFDLFLVPIGPDGRGMRYEAVFA
jgi:Domain of unknown function (DUF6916)